MTIFTSKRYQYIMFQKNVKSLFCVQKVIPDHVHVILLMVCEAEMHAGDIIGPHSSLNIASNHNIY